MSVIRFICIFALIAVIGAGNCFADAGSETTVVTIDVTKKAEPISEYIYGQFIEHLGRCIDGGIWAEMINDRKFYFTVGEEKSPWKPLGNAKVEMNRKDPFVGEQSPQISAPGGIVQSRLALVADKEYIGRIRLKGDGQIQAVEINLIWADDPNSRQTITTEKITADYTLTPLSFRSKANANNARLEITARGSGSFSIGTVSLMPADNVEGMRADTLKLLKELDSPIYRWPGGNFVSGYDWRDGIGPRDKRPPRLNLAWPDKIESNDFGIHEFMTFCRLLETEPYIAVNSGLGDAHSAAKQIEYVNGSTDTAMGAARAANGHQEPFGVKWWGIGNEMYGDWQLGHMSLGHYTLKHNRFAAAMRQADPSIKLVAVGDAGPWSEGMLKSCADSMDLIAEHFYCEREKEVLADYVALIRDNVRRKVNAHRDYRKRLGSLRDKDIRIAIDEWNYWYGPRHYNMKDAMGIAAGLHEMFRSSDIVFMANYAQTVNVIGAIKTSRTAAAFDTTGLVLKMYRRRFGLIPVQVSGVTEPLDIAAALTEDNTKLTIGVVNPTEQDLEMPIELKNAAPAKRDRYRWRIAHPDPMAYNEPGKRAKIKIEETIFGDGASDTLRIPPISVCIYQLPLE
ncbi:MAG: hypothetical protein JW720_09940 [Sedimentisphaerales bacterium]|nr:hypothetical protein [Sedimentisphaerales bacterium]